MLPPKKPKQPVKPVAPSQQIVQTILEFLGDWDEKPLQDLLDTEFRGIDPTEIRIVCERDDNGYGGDYEYRMALQYSWVDDDPKYDEKMTKYHSQLEKYEEARRQYLLDVEEYKQKLKTWHEEQLKDLTD